MRRNLSQWAAERISTPVEVVFPGTGYTNETKRDLVNTLSTYSDNLAYILKLLLSVITVSLKTRELVQSLPSIDFDSLIASMDKAG